jgi:glutathione synthase
VSVFYFRAGYAPADYPSEVEWIARRKIECSNAVACPSVAYQLVGTKKVQQDLARPGVTDRNVSLFACRTCRTSWCLM